MARLDEIIYHLRSLYERRPTDEADLSDAEWAFVIHAARATLLSKKLDEGVTLSSEHEQDFTVKLQRLEKGDANYVYTCRSYRTDPIPTFLSSRKGECITRLSETPLEPSYKLIKMGNISYELAARLTSRRPKVALLHSRFYVYALDAMEDLYSAGVFANPSQVRAFTKQQDVFRPYAYEYPLATSYLEELYKIIINTDFRILKSTVLDLQNDGHAPTPSA